MEACGSFGAAPTVLSPTNSGGAMDLAQVFRTSQLGRFLPIDWVGFDKITIILVAGGGGKQWTK